MIAFTCPYCGGSVRYDLSSGAVRCEYCDGLITQTDYESYLDQKGLYQTTELCCSQCGSVVLSYSNTIATFCSYCGSSVMFDRRVREEQKPDGMIPFSCRKDTALKRYREKTNRLLLAPDWVREEGRRDLTGIYMPYYMYTASCQAPVSVTAQKSKNLGRYTEISEYEVSGTLSGRYQGSRFDAAVAFPDALSESIDSFEWRRAEDFRPGYVAGYYADGSDVDPAEYDPVMARLVSDDINSTSSVSYQGMSLYLGGSTRADNVLLSKKKLLLPVWLLTHRVGDRICYAAVNGQNGNIAADIPLDRKRYLKVSLIVTALIAAFLNLFFTVKPETFLWVSMILTGIFGIVLGRLTQDVYVRENHLDDIGRIGYRAFAEAVRNVDSGQKKARSSGGFWPNAGIYGIALFFVWPFFFGILSDIFPDSIFMSFTALVWVILISVGGIRFITGLVRSITGTAGTSSGSKRSTTRWKYSKSHAAAFSVLWKVWLALAAGALVLAGGSVEDPWYYSAGILNIAVSVWASLDVIRKQNLLASRDIPLFSMKRGGAE